MWSDRMEMLRAQSQEQIDSLYNNVRDVPQVFAAAMPASGQAWQMVTKASRSGGRGWATATPLPDRTPHWDDEYATWFLRAPEPQEGIDLIAGSPRARSLM